MQSEGDLVWKSISVSASGGSRFTTVILYDHDSANNLDLVRSSWLDTIPCALMPSAEPSVFSGRDYVFNTKTNFRIIASNLFMLYWVCWS